MFKKRESTNLLKNGLPEVGPACLNGYLWVTGLLNDILKRKSDPNF
jgi:hypothetical protein